MRESRGLRFAGDLRAASLTRALSPPRCSPNRSQGLILAVGFVVLVLSGCTRVVIPPRSVSPDPSTGSSIATSAPAESSTAIPLTRLPPPSPRRTEPVPDVVPPGVVDPPGGRGVARYTGQSITWTGCRRGLQCATVLAPLDWSAPDGRAVTLSISRRPARTEPASGVLFVNPGGPGGSGLDLPRSLPDTGLDGFNIVGWDPRGVGESTPVRCLDPTGTEVHLQVDTSPDDAAEVTELEKADRTLGLACLANSGTLLTQVSTQSTVRDLDLLRQLLGADTIDFYGASYGTVIGSLYAQLFPDRVGRFVLDGAVVLGDDEVELQTKGFSEAYATFAGWCAARSCALGGSTAAVITTTTDLLTRLDARPIAVGDRQLTQSLAMDGIVHTLYGDAGSYPLLSQVLAAAVDGNGRPLLTVADFANQRNDDGSYGQINAAFPAIRCLDQGDRGVAAAVAEGRRLAAEAAGLGRFLGPDLTCPEWPVAAKPYGRRITAPNAPPILVVGTTGDPATPYVSAERLAAQLRSGRLLTFRGVGHTAYQQSTCVQEKVAAFLVDGTLPAVGTTC
ncbi:MAG: alpha/beta hydrolase [Propionibacteriaceae bacterium]